MTLGELIKKYRDDNSLTMQEVADKIGMSKGTISLLEKGFNPQTGKKIVPKIETVSAISELIGIDFDILIRNLDEDTEIMVGTPENISTKAIPLLGSIAAGSPILAEENIEDYIALDSRFNADFCLRVRGDSMIDEGIYDGDIAFLKKQDDVDNGEVAAVVIDNEATLKTVFKTNESLILQPANKAYKPMVMTSGNVRIVGRLVSVLNIKK